MYFQRGAAISAWRMLPCCSNSLTSCKGKQVYGQVFCIFQLLLGDFLHVRSQETVGNVGVGTWIGRDLHELFPYSVSIAGFFQKFPLCGNHRRAVLFFAYPCTELIGRSCMPCRYWRIKTNCPSRVMAMVFTQLGYSNI